MTQMTQREVPSQASVVATSSGGSLVLCAMTDAMQQNSVRAIIRDLACDDCRAPRFPGPNPVSLDTSHFAKLRGEPYYICEKTDGVRFLMLVCMLPPHAPSTTPIKLVALVDRAFNAYILPMRHVPKAMYQGTLLDGELVWNRAAEAWEFLIFDAMSVSGIPVINCTLPDRLRAAKRALGSYAHTAGHDPVQLALKTFVPCSQFEDAERHLHSAQGKYATDGVILTPALTPVVYGRHMGMFKVKFASKHTVDFLVGADGRQLCVFDAGRHVQVGTLGSAASPGTIAECCLAQPDQGVWQLVTVRTDKKTANDMFTYQKTLLNMKENLTLEHVKRVFAVV